MGQKVHPIGFRLGFNKTWRSRWYAEKEYANLLHEDVVLKKELKKRFSHAGVSRVDIERLYVLACYANQGPSMKRVRPAPMGRAFRVVKRTAHLTVRVAERPLKIARVATDADASGSKRAAAAKSEAKAAKPARTKKVTAKA